MSYLIGARLHFAGRFTADVSTVNNDPQHFRDPNQPPGQGWNPRGTGSWKVDGCTVTSAVFADGTVARTAADDPVVGASNVQAGQARLVDLDPEQQLVSQIWGLRLSLTRTAGASPAFAGVFKVAAFSDLWPGSRRRSTCSSVCGSAAATWWTGRQWRVPLCLRRRQGDGT